MLFTYFTEKMKNHANTELECMNVSRLAEKNGASVVVNGFRVESAVYRHLGRRNARAEGVLRDVVSANVFDMVDSKEEIEGMISRMRYWETIEEYNAANGDELTEEEILDKDGFCPLCCYDGFVAYHA